MEALKALSPEKAKKQLQDSAWQMTALNAQLAEKHARLAAVGEEQRQASETDVYAKQEFQEQLSRSGLESQEEFQISRMERAMIQAASGSKVRLEN